MIYTMQAKCRFYQAKITLFRPMYKKKVCLLFLLLWAVAGLLHAQWRPAGGPFGGAVWDLKSNARFVFVTQSNGIYRKAATGGNWTLCDTARVHHLTVRGAALLALSYDFHYLRYSTDHGAHWSGRPLPDSIRFARDWAFKDSLFVVSAAGRLWRSTDRGVSWRSQRIAGETEHAYDAVEVIGDWFYAANGLHLFRSADGLQWAPLAPVPALFGAIFQLFGENNRLLAFTGPALYYSDNGGSSWQLAQTPAASLGPLPPNFAIQGGRWFAASGRMLVSDDLGAHWQPAPGNSQAAWDLWAVASGTDGVFCGSQSTGIYRTDDLGQHFYPDNKGLSGSSVADVLFAGDTLYGWDVQGISRTTWPGFSWDTSHLYNGGAAPGDLFAFRQILFAKSAGSDLLRSADGGKNWKPVSLPGWTEQGQAVQHSIKGDTLFLWSAGGDLWHSTDGGLQWTHTGAELLTRHGFKTEAWAVAAGACFLLSDGFIYRSEDGLKTWVLAGPAPATALRLFGVSGRLFALASGDTPELYVSADKGQSWQMAEVPWAPAFNGHPSLRVSLFEAGGVWTGAFEQGGVFWAPADALHWKPFAEGLPVPVKIKDMAQHQAVLALATNQGLFLRAVDDLKALHANDISNTRLPIRIGPNPGEGIFWVALETASPAQLHVYTPDGRLVHQKTLQGQGVIDLSSYPDGAYILNVWANGQSNHCILIKTSTRR